MHFVELRFDKFEKVHKNLKQKKAADFDDLSKILLLMHIKA